MTDDPSTVPARHRKRGARSADPGAASRRGWNEVPETVAATHRATLPAAAEGASRARRHVLPVKRAGREMLLRALVDGSVRVPFVVDTGAMGNTIPSWAVEKLGITIDDRTPVIPVTGIGGRTMLRPVVTLRSVRVGSAIVEQVDAVVLDTMSKGLLGMPFFNNFRVSTDPAAGTLTLEEIDLGSIPGIYGGLDEEAWRSRFGFVRSQQERIEAYRRRYDGHLGAEERLDSAEEYWQAQLEELERKATRAGVPHPWRR